MPFPPYQRTYKPVGRPKVIAHWDQARTRAEFFWSKPKQLAAKWIAENELPTKEIAERLGVSIRTVDHWREKPEFLARIEEISQAYANRILGTSIARKAKRVEALDGQWKAQSKIIEERAAAAEPDVPGMSTGYIVRQEKMIGTGAAAMPVTEYVYDSGLASDIRATLKQAAQECNQWTEKREITGLVQHEHEHTLNLTGLNDNELDALEVLISKTIAGDVAGSESGEVPPEVQDVYSGSVAGSGASGAADPELAH